MSQPLRPYLTTSSLYLPKLPSELGPPRVITLFLHCPVRFWVLTTWNLFLPRLQAGIRASVQSHRGCVGLWSLSPSLLLLCDPPSLPLTSLRIIGFCGQEWSGSITVRYHPAPAMCRGPGLGPTCAACATRVLVMSLQHPREDSFVGPGIGAHSGGLSHVLSSLGTAFSCSLALGGGTPGRAHQWSTLGLLISQAPRPLGTPVGHSYWPGAGTGPPSYSASTYPHPPKPSQPDKVGCDRLHRHWMPSCLEMSFDVGGGPWS